MVLDQIVEIKNQVVVSHLAKKFLEDDVDCIDYTQSRAPVPALSFKKVGVAHSQRTINNLDGIAK
jgi:hypothetical protein